ncbi:MAG TPA: thiamine pyrophosphate-dependent enzyme, partial [Burkholderiales bacterium]
GDEATVLDALAAQLGATQSKCWLDVADFRARKHAKLVQRAGSALAVIEALRAAVPDDTIFVDDLALVGYWMPLLMDTYHPRTLIHPGTYGTLGYSLPAAIGAKLARPRQPVVSISGDGGFLFTLQELATARAENLDLVALVFNDNAFGAIKTYQDRVFSGRYIGTKLVNPDFVKLGEAFGAKSVRVDAKEVGPAVRRAQQEGGLWLIEVPFAPQGPATMVPWMP